MLSDKPLRILTPRVMSNVTSHYSSLVVSADGIAKPAALKQAAQQFDSYILPISQSYVLHSFISIN